MTAQEVKSILISARNSVRIYRTARDKANTYRQLLSSGKSMRCENDGAVHERSGNSVELAYCRLADYDAECDRALGNMHRSRIKAEKLIASVPDGAQREILKRRYIIVQDWEDIAYVMNYTRRHILRLHGYALAAIARGEKNEVSHADNGKADL